MKTPAHYSLPNHLARLHDSPAFADAAKQVSIALDDFRNAVAAELKKVTKEVAEQELKDFEAVLGPKALANALEKFKDDLRVELKKAHAKIQHDELVHFERDVGKRALAAAAKR